MRLTYAMRETGVISIVMNSKTLSHPTKEAEEKNNFSQNIYSKKGYGELRFLRFSRAL